jgi:hypothetical protein
MAKRHIVCVLGLKSFEIPIKFVRIWPLDSYVGKDFVRQRRV